MEISGGLEKKRLMKGWIKIKDNIQNVQKQIPICLKNGILFVLLLLPAFCLAAKIKVTDSLINIMSGPGRNYEIIAQVKKGELLEILEETSEWFKVKLKDGREGWIYGKSTSLIYEVEKKGENYIWHITGNKTIQLLKRILPHVKEGSNLKVTPLPCFPKGLLTHSDIITIIGALKAMGWKGNWMEKDFMVGMVCIIQVGIALQADYQKLMEICNAFADVYEMRKDVAIFATPYYIFGASKQISDMPKYIGLGRVEYIHKAVLFCSVRLCGGVRHFRKRGYCCFSYSS
jgi:hypothetical protein